MVNVNAGRETVRAYVIEQAAKGLENVKALIGGDRGAIEALTAGLSEDEANFRPSDDEFSIVQVLQHLGGNIERSADRLKTLSSGRQWVNSGPSAGPGSIPAGAPTSFAEVRHRFLEGEDAIFSILDAADPSARLELTVPHAGFGPFNWLEWAVYSHHVHARDHVEQIEKIRAELQKRRKVS